MKRFTAILLMAVAVLSLPGSSGYSEGPRVPIHRLPNTVTPLKYTLQIEPDLDTAVVTGTVTIQLKTTSNQSSDPMDAITLHLGEDSEINETSVSLSMLEGGTPMTDLSFRYLDDDYMIQVVLPMDTSLAYDTIYVLTLDFTSPLYTEPKGLFWGSFSSDSKYVASAFRATYARNLFPCFDEPQFQVPLTLMVVRPTMYNVTFTTALQSSVSIEDKVIDTFETTPTGISLSSLGLFMSRITPQLAMGVSLYVPEGFNTSVTFLQTLLEKITSTMGSFPTPTKNLNLVVLPDMIYNSFSSLGFVFTSPEVYLGNVAAQMQWLNLRQQLAESFLQQYLAYTHTPQWWSDLWLSDSLAAYLALLMLPEEPEVQGLLITQIRCNGFNNDYGSFSGPVVNDDLMARLDIESAITNQTIKYKGLSVLLMWHDTLPKGLLMNSVLNFTGLEKTLTTTQDFLNILVTNIKAEKSIKTAVIQEIPYWLNSTGNPVVNVTVRATNKATIMQSPEGSDDVLWPISISLATAKSPNWTTFRQGLWLTGKSMRVTASNNQWMILNLENAPYRVNYGSSYQQVLAALEAAGSSTIPPSVRASIQSDAMDLALSGSLDFATALMVMNNTQHKQEDWMPVARAMDTIAALMGTGKWALAQFGMYVETMFTPELLDTLDLTNSTMNPDKWLVRSLLTPWLCRFDIGNCRAAVIMLAPSIMQNDETSSALDANDMDNVACLGARYMATSVDNILSNYATAKTLYAKRMFKLALGCVIDPDSVQRVLTEVTSSSSQFTVRDVRDIMVGLANNPENSQTMASFIVDNAETIQQMIGSAYISDIIKALGKFKIHATKLESLASSEVDVNFYVKQTAMATINRINSSFAWWSEYGQALEQAIIQTPVSPPAPSAPSTAPTTTTTTAAPMTIPVTNGSTVTPPTTVGPVSSAPSLGVATFFSLLLVALSTAFVGNH